MVNLMFDYIVHWDDDGGNRLFSSKDSLTEIRKKCMAIAKKQFKQSSAPIIQFMITRKYPAYKSRLTCTMRNGKVAGYYTSDDIIGQRIVGIDGKLRQF